MAKRQEADAGCIFCRIAAGEFAASVVYEDRAVVAFLDSKPLIHGHCLVVPRLHVEALADLPDDLVTPLFTFVRRLAGVMETGFGADGSFVAINTHMSQSVPHLHVHVVPRYKGDGLFARGMVWIRKPYASADEMEVVRARIAAALGNPRADT